MEALPAARVFQEREVVREIMKAFADDQKCACFGDNIMTPSIMKALKDKGYKIRLDKTTEVYSVYWVDAAKELDEESV